MVKTPPITSPDDIRFSDLCSFQQKQLEALKAVKTHTYTLYGGSAGGG